MHIRIWSEKVIMAEKARAFIQRMKVRDMRVPIKEDFTIESLDFDVEAFLQQIYDERLGWDFVSDSMVDISD